MAVAVALLTQLANQNMEVLEKLLRQMFAPQYCHSISFFRLRYTYRGTSPSLKKLKIQFKRVP